MITVPRYNVAETELETEWQRYQDAVKRAADEIRGIQNSLECSRTEQHKLLDAQLLMLHDPEMTDHIRIQIYRTRHNAEWILSDYIENMVNILRSSADAYLAERSLDILDVSRRITNQLLYRKRMTLAGIEKEVILVARNLMPSETILLDTEKVMGIAQDAGGRTSHTAILARSFGIPAVLGLRTICHNIRPDDLVIVDGDRGVVIVEPDEETLLRYRRELERLKKREAMLIGIRDLPPVTSDGREVSLVANIEMPEEVEAVIEANAQGVGLFRSEFLFMKPTEQPDEDTQFRAYVSVLEAMAEKPVTIRTLDVGGDKLLPSMDESEENNPILGWRAIRFCLEEEVIFRTQLRALLRASVFGNLRIMFPLISNAEELDTALAMLGEERRKLSGRGVSIAERIPVGIMIEVPSAAVISDILARKSDFFSIGTNDLIQYTMAVDRSNEKVASLFQPYHPALWRLIKMTVDNAKAAGIPVGVCGEIAGDPASAVLLMALGIDQLSMGAYSISSVKRIIRSVSMEESVELLNAVMKMSTGEEVENHLNTWLGAKLDD